MSDPGPTEVVVLTCGPTTRASGKQRQRSLKDRVQFGEIRVGAVHQEQKFVEVHAATLALSGHKEHRNEKSR
jgi:hypothetical protein